MRNLLILGLLALTAGILPGNDTGKSPPNIVVILCDDLGYGDVQALNPAGKIPTPVMDRLAREGMTFTDAHSASSVCTPTRYGLLTGRYPWRSKLKSGVLGGLSPRLIEPNRPTVASLLQTRGYHTACIGKWHLGMDWKRKPGKQVNVLGIESREQVFNVEYDQSIANGPNAVGFDYYYGISASLDMVPYTFIVNDRVESLPSEDRDFPMMLGRMGRCRKGPAAPEFEAIDVLPTLTRKSCEYISQRAPAAKDGKPFFLYVPLASPHTPILPTPEWQGRTALNPYGDFVAQTDAAIGAILARLEKEGLAENTLFIVTSDNGCSPQADFPALKEKGHNPSAQFRGYKADIFEGGHRVPFVVRWPGHVTPGSTSGQLVCLNDIARTCADIAGVAVPDQALEDSFSFLPALQGKSDAKGLRDHAIHHSINGSFALRQGDWKLCLCPGSGGWSAPRPGSPGEKGLHHVQLFNLKADIGEQTNLAMMHTDVVTRMTQQLEALGTAGRTTPGGTSPNTTPVDVWRGVPKALR